VIKRNSFIRTFLLAFILIIVIPVTILGVVIYNNYIDSLLQNTTNQVLQSLRQASKGMEDEVAGLTRNAIKISKDDTLLELATEYHRAGDDLTKLEIKNKIDSRIDFSLVQLYSTETVLFVYKDKGAYFYNKGPTVEIDQIKGMNWYKQAVENKGMLYYDIIETYSDFFQKKYVFNFAYALQNYWDTDVELVAISFNINAFNGIISGEAVNQTGNYMVLDQDGKIIFSRVQDRIGKSIEETGYSRNMLGNSQGSYIETVDNEKMLVTSYSLSKYGWVIVNMIPYDELTDDVNQYTKYGLWIGLLLFLLFIVFSFIFFKQIIIPIQHLIVKMKNVEKLGDFNQTVEIKGRNEIFYLGHAFNKMMHEIQSLMNERDLKEQEKIKFEIEALQSQINPHFLFNTLSSIRLMAIVAKSENVKNMLEAFIKLLSNTHKDAQNIITIEEEMENLKQYIYIMKYRYGNSFAATIEIEEEIKEYMILKLLIQPIVENAILHGMSDLDRQGKIEIQAWANEKSIMISVRDNGNGMNEKQIEELLSKPENNEKGFTGIGVQNVDRRIKLNYGDNYGVIIDSEEDIYTEIRMIIPKIKR